MKKSAVASKLGYLLGACLAFSPIFAKANLLFNVSLDTSQFSTLYGSSSYFIDFQLIDGDGFGNNTVILSNFQFDEGAAEDPPSEYCDADLTGGGDCLGVMGDLSTTVTLNDVEFVNGFFQEFTLGSLLSVDVNLTTHFGGGSTLDRFSFALTDNGSFFDEFVYVDINSSSPTIFTPSVFFEEENVTLTASIRPITTSSIPEPKTLGLLLGGLALLGWWQRHRRPSTGPSIRAV